MQKVQSVEKAIVILNCFINHHELGPAAIAKLTGMPRSMVYRFLISLEEGGLISRTSRGQYKLGINLVKFGQLVLERTDLRSIAHPYLEELSITTQEIVHLGMLNERCAIVYIDKIDTPQPVRIHSSIGRECPLYCTGIGKAYAAFRREDEWEEIIPSYLKQHTPNTITDRERLWKEFRQIRVLGYALDEEEHEVGIRCIGVPVFDSQGQVTGSISIASPVSRVTREKITQIIPLIKSVGGKISYDMGYLDPGETLD